ncbi:MAG: hypothetical protein D6765_06085 [Bacteroidetes bacterium]|nr:MAG: hypothetical protein D6765_06085 [Bacteroidota bacterium]
MKTRLHVLLLATLGLFLLSCGKDDPAPFPTDDPTGLEMHDSAALFMSFDLLTSRQVVPKNPADTVAITEGEKILSLPKFKGCHVDVLLGQDGSYSADVEMVDFPEFPDYPPNTIGIDRFPEHLQTKRIEIRDAVVTYYGNDGQVLMTEFEDPDILLLIQNLVQGMTRKNLPPLPPEGMDLLLQAFHESGFEITPTELDHLVALTHRYDDGSKSVLIIDKQLQLITGQANYDPAGNLSTKSDFHFQPDPQTGQPVLTGHRFVTYYDSPFSNVKMAVVQRSAVRNFVLQTAP